jgi:hypothetical protein
MADLQSFIFNQSDPNVNQQLRQRIALAMMQKQRKYPKTFGEGLAAIGDSLGEIGMARRIEAADAADNARAKALVNGGGVSAEADTPAPSKAAEIPPETAPSSSDVPMVAAAQPSPRTITPAPGNLPPTGEPGNTGATTFPPPYQPPPEPAPNTTGEDPRRAIALSMLKQGRLGQPQNPMFAPAASEDMQGPPDPSLEDPRRAVGLDMLKQGNLGQPQSPQFAPSTPDDPRRAIALDMMKQGNLGQPQNRNFAPATPGPTADAGTPPVMAFDGQPAKAPGMPPMPLQAAPQQAIRQAPPVAPPIAPAPPAPPQAAVPGPGYVMPTPKEPVAPAQVPMTPRETLLRKIISDNQNNPYVAQQANNELTQLQTAREFEQNRRLEKYKDDMIQHRALQLEQQKQLQAAPADVRAAESHTTAERKARDEEKVRAQFANMDPKQVFTTMEDSKKTATAAKEGLVAADMARKAIKDGAIVGAGADPRLFIAKVVTGLGLKDMGSQVANTESFRSYMAPLIASALKSTVGNQNISNSDREFAAAAAGGSIKLEGESIKRIIDFVGRASRETLNEHETKVNTLFGQNPQGRALFGVDAPPVEKSAPLVPLHEKSQHEAAQEWLKANPNDPRAPAVRKRLGM